MYTNPVTRKDFETFLPNFYGTHKVMLLPGKKSYEIISGEIGIAA
jgi:hypothetical protein